MVIKAPSSEIDRLLRVLASAAVYYHFSPRMNWAVIWAEGHAQVSG